MDRAVTVRTYLDFEKPIAELESKVAELKMLESGDSVSITDEIKKLEQKAHTALVDTYAKLTPWQKTQVARHPERPHCLDYVGALIEEFTPLAGDRYFAEDEAIVGGVGTFRGRSVVVIGYPTTTKDHRPNPAQGGRKPLSEIVSYDRFGGSGNPADG